MIGGAQDRRPGTGAPTRHREPGERRLSPLANGASNTVLHAISGSGAATAVTVAAVAAGRESRWLPGGAGMISNTAAVGRTLGMTSATGALRSSRSRRRWPAP